MQPQDLQSQAMEESISALHKDLKAEAIKCISHTLPSRIIELKAIVDEKNSSFGKYLESDEIFDALIKEYEEFKEFVNAQVQAYIRTRTALHLLVPKIEDGNNFGVGVQHEILSALSNSVDVGIASLDSSTQFFINRAELVGKAAKYGALSPQAAAAFSLAIAEYDRKKLRMLVIFWMDLLNNCIFVHDLIMKNLDKLLAPRTSNATNMY